MLLPFVRPGGHGFSLVLMIQFPKYSPFGLVLGNCIIRTKENPRPPGPPHGNVSLLMYNYIRVNVIFFSKPEICMVLFFLSLRRQIHNIMHSVLYIHIHAMQWVFFSFCPFIRPYVDDTRNTHLEDVNKNLFAAWFEHEQKPSQYRVPQKSF